MDQPLRVIHEPEANPAQIGYKPQHPTPPNVTRRSRRPPAVPTIKALSRVLPAALHQQVQRQRQYDLKGALAGRADLRDDRPPARAGLGRCGQGGASRRSPPRATTRHPGGRARRARHRLRRGLPPGCRAVGLRQIDGMPHDSQRARSSVVVRQRKASRPLARRRIDARADTGGHCDQRTPARRNARTDVDLGSDKRPPFRLAH